MFETNVLSIIVSFPVLVRAGLCLVQTGTGLSCPQSSDLIFLVVCLCPTCTPMSFTALVQVWCMDH